MPKILALDTSTDACSVALYNEGEITEDFRVIPRQHTQQLLPMTEALLAEAGLKVTELDAIAFGRGPGSFAGIRIATGVAQGLAYAANLPVLPISTLKAMALAAVQEGLPSGKQHVVSALDARMNEIYVAAYEVNNGSLTAVLDETVCAPQALSLPDHQYFAIGSGFTYFNDMPESVQRCLSVTDNAVYPSAATMLHLALDDWDNGLAVSPEQALPVYLRDDVAWKKKDQQ